MEAIRTSLELIVKIKEMVELYGANKKAVEDLTLAMRILGRLYSPLKGMACFHCVNCFHCISLHFDFSLLLSLSLPLSVLVFFYTQSIKTSTHIFDIV